MIGTLLDNYRMANSILAKNSDADYCSSEFSRTSASQRGGYIHVPYVPIKEFVGYLLRLPNTTSPDIAYATTHLSRFMYDTKTVHSKRANLVLRYLKISDVYTISYSLHYEGL